MSRRFPLRCSPLNKALLTALGMGPRSSLVEVDAAARVQMGWGFSASIPRASVVGVRRDPSRPLNVGVHGWHGRWLVSGAREGIVKVAIEPSARASVCGVPVSLRELRVSLEEPEELIASLAQAP